jgi:hypothetical protein
MSLNPRAMSFGDGERWKEERKGQRDGNEKK